mmetsp:Transcript_33580/g.73286  ORF Transcript_33580/g.73286 Transcript_33580/m.73286 type:complete len:250 (+) Transcript_33580:452-1201(+)
MPWCLSNCLVFHSAWWGYRFHGSPAEEGAGRVVGEGRVAGPRPRGGAAAGELATAPPPDPPTPRGSIENPVAMMVTCTSPSYASSITAPKMTLAAGSASPVTTSDTMFTSCRVRSLPPVMLYTSPVARSMDLSMSGADVAASAASSARFLPELTPTPSMAVPELVIIAFTSAKSTFTSPGMVMMSEIPCTPCLRTSSASKKASCSGVPSSTTSSRRSFGMMMSVSTLRRRFSMASCACLARRRPSKVKG